MPEEFLINDNSIIPPAEKGDEVEVVRGPNIKPFPINTPLSDQGRGGCTPEDGGQYYNGSYYALQCKAAAIQVQHSPSVGLLPCSGGSGISKRAKGSRRQVPGSGSQLWPGIKQGACSPCALCIWA